MKDEEMAEKKYCKGCKLRMEQCLWAWRKVNGLNEPNEKNCSCKEVPAFLAGLKAGRPQWHKLSEKYPEADKLIRVRLMSGMEHICETCYYEPTEDEIGYGKLIINFYELNGEWVDDNEIKYWCEIPTFDKE